MKPDHHRLTAFYTLLSVSVLFFMFSSCGIEPEAEEIHLNELLPETAMTEVDQAYPDLKVMVVSENKSNVATRFGDRFLRIDGIDNEEQREEFANWIVQYLENPNKAEEDKKKRAAYEKLSPEEKLAELIERMESHYPEFGYEWVGPDVENVTKAFGERSIIITGVDDDGSQQEIAGAIYRHQTAIEKARKEAYESLPAQERMDRFVERMKSRYPEFDYEWVRLGEGNTDIEYGDNGLTIKGVEGNTGEIAFEIHRLQKQIDANRSEEQE